MTRRQKFLVTWRNVFCHAILHITLSDMFDFVPKLLKERGHKTYKLKLEQQNFQTLVTTEQPA